MIQEIWLTWWINVFELGGYVFIWVRLLVGLSAGLRKNISKWSSMKPEQRELISD